MHMLEVLCEVENVSTHWSRHLKSLVDKHGGDGVLILVVFHEFE